VLFARQGEQIAREQAFLADSSHVLRTPLAVLRGNIDLLEGAGSEGERREAPLHARSALETMSRTVGGLLLLARDEASAEAWEIVDLSRLASALVEGARTASPALALSAEVAPGLEVSNDPHQLQELVGALLENATRYTLPGGSVVMRVAPGEGHTAVVEIEDTGSDSPRRRRGGPPSASSAATARGGSPRAAPS